MNWEWRNEPLANETKAFVEEVREVIKKHRVKIEFQCETSCPEYHGEYDEHEDSIWMVLRFPGDKIGVIVEDFDAKYCKVYRQDSELEAHQKDLESLEYHRSQLEYHKNEFEKIERKITNER